MAKATLFCSECGCQSGGPGPDYGDVKIGGRMVPAIPANMVYCFHTLPESILEQAHAAEFSDDVQPRNVSLKVLIVIGDFHALFRPSEPHGDCGDRTSFRTKCMTDAPCAEACP